ncbi:pRL2-8 [Streptomyces sp. NPDC058297]|uniref:pRL2-8 n=1 Tax=Streptomyces sp. NPDC058297 TaxID=3346433 RepID=UPI0036F12797
MSKARAANPPKGQCKDCWAHAEDPDIHRQNRGDCQACIACAANRHAGKIVR